MSLSQTGSRAEARRDGGLPRRLLGQGLMLSSGFVAGQIASFARNAILGHLLSKGDFGVGATILIALQTLEIATDIAADRMILQADDGDDPRLIATAHSIQVFRGLLTALTLWLAGPLVARFFGVAEAAWVFQAAAVVPLLKGLTHLDARRMQRRLSHGPFALTEMGPQLIATLATLPILWIWHDFTAVLWLSVVQAAAGVIVSHMVAERAYTLDIDRRHLTRLVTFGWPVLLGALPLIAVYHGERAVIGHFRGVEALAGYTAAFLITMVPGLIASKLALSLMLPVLAARKDDSGRFNLQSRLMFEAGGILAAAYVVFFAVAGEHVLSIAFGARYQGLGPLVSWLAIMFAIRMLQAAPGTVLMALGDTRTLLVAGVLRAAALGLAFHVAVVGGGLIEIAAAGAAGEFISLLYITWRLEAARTDLGAAFLGRAALLVPPIALALAFEPAVRLHAAGAFAAISGGVLAAVCVAGFATLLSPQLFRFFKGPWANDGKAASPFHTVPRKF